MATHQAQTLVPIAADRQALMLEKLTRIEEALEGFLPLLEKIVTHLETQTGKAQVPIAPYEALYAMTDAGPPEGELVAANIQHHASRPVGWWRRLLTTRTEP